MNKVLQRAMFNIPKHEHQSTGIASGLEYRPGYRVGGRVGFDAGGHAHPHVEEMPNPNPDVSMGSGIDIAGLQSMTDLLYKNYPTTDWSQYGIDYTDPALQMDYSKYTPSRMGAVGQAAAETIGEPIPEGQSQWAKFIGNLSGTSTDYKARRQELDRLADEQRIKTELATKEQDKEFGIATAGEDQKLEAAKIGTTQDLLKTQMNLLKDKDPNAWTFVEKTLIAKDVDIDNPESWSAEDIKNTQDAMALATGELTEVQMAHEMKKQRLNLLGDALRMQSDQYKKKIFTDDVVYKEFMAQFDQMLIDAKIMPSTEPMNLDFAALAENNSKIKELAETKNLPNIFSTSEDLLTQAQSDENLMKILKKAQSGYMQFLNDNFTLAQMLQAMGIINEQLTQAGYDPINLDLLQ